jgi:hypothetical protein
MADLQDVKHREIVELLPWYLNQTLQSKQRTQVESHLRECSFCRQELEELSGLQKVVAAEEPQFSEALLAGTLEDIRARQEPASRERFGGWTQWRKMLRPRLALGLSALAIAFLVLGGFLGFQLGAHRIIGSAPGPGERAYQTTEQYFAFPRAIELQGTFTMQIGNRLLEQETFTLERLEDGKELFTSNIQANELAATQRLQLTSDLRPLSYSLQGPLVYRGIRAEASFSDSQATLSVCCTVGASGQEISRRIIPLEGFPVLYDFSVMSHFALLHRVLTEQLARGASLKDLQFTALTPQALRAEPLWVEEIQPATLTSQERVLSVTRYRLAIGQKENPLRVELYAPENEELIAIYISTQPRLASTSAIFAYRSDLYPQGLEIPRHPK